MNNSAAYTGGNWTNTTFVGRLARTNPNPAGAADDLDGNDGRRTNALAAGLPANHFVLNPDVDDSNVFVSDAFSSYDALQIEVRRRLSRGFQVNGSYAFAFEEGSAFLGRHYGRVSNPGATVRHAFKIQWDWTIPVGRGRRYGTDMNPWLDAVVGGWEVNGAGRIQARVLNFGNVRMVGMTLDELTDEYKFRILPNPSDPTLTIVTMLPEDIITNTRRAFNTSATSATGYSDHGVPEGRYFAPANSPDCIQLKAGRLRAAHAARARAVVHALRHQRRQALPGREAPELRAALRPAERVRQRQLHARWPIPAPARRSSRPTPPTATSATRSTRVGGSGRSCGGSIGRLQSDYRPIGLSIIGIIGLSASGHRSSGIGHRDIGAPTMSRCQPVRCDARDDLHRWPMDRCPDDSIAADGPTMGR